MASGELIVCSHRGPYVFEQARTGLVSRRGGGGAIGAVASLVERLGGTWIAAALTEGDRAAARDPRRLDGFTLRLLDLPPESHTLHYDVVSNEYLWFLFHYLFDVPNAPVFDGHFSGAWDAYRRVNETFADAVSAAGPARAILVQDYHLMLVPSLLRARRIRRPILYFHHTPWCVPDYFAFLPDAIRSQILRGLLDCDVVGFHAQRWADAFVDCCRAFLPRSTFDGRAVRLGRRSTQVVVTPAPIDRERLLGEVNDARTIEWSERHDEARAGRKMLLRVDRIDLSKNPLRGFLAFEHVLDRNPRRARDVVFVALIYPSRQKIEAYRRYFAACTGVVRRINDKFPNDEPVRLHFEDDYYRSLGAMRIHDTLLVNPVFDGLNLVAKEAATANTTDGVTVLSRNAGVFEELGPASVAVNPFDVGATADAIELALDMPAAQRKKVAARARRLATRSTPDAWARAQLSAAGLEA